MEFEFFLGQLKTPKLRTAVRWYQPSSIRLRKAWQEKEKNEHVNFFSQSILGFKAMYWKIKASNEMHGWTFRILNSLILPSFTSFKILEHQESKVQERIQQEWACLQHCSRLIFHVFKRLSSSQFSYLPGQPGSSNSLLGFTSMASPGHTAANQYLLSSTCNYMLPVTCIHFTTTWLGYLLISRH